MHGVVDNGITEQSVQLRRHHANKNPEVENEETLSTSNTEITPPLPTTTTTSLEVPPQVTRSGRSVKPATRLDSV